MAPILDHSQLVCFQQCPEKYRLTYVERLRRQTDEDASTPLRFGKGLHAGLQAWHRHQDMNIAFLKEYPAALSATENLYTPANGLTTLQQYSLQYATDLTDYTIVAVEQPVVLTLSDGTPYLVKMDTVLKDQQGGIWVKETKSTAAKNVFTDAWWARWEPNSQISGEVAACRHQWGSCEGVILDGIGLSYGPRKGFVAELQRQSFHRSPEQLADWDANTLAVIKRLQALSPAHQWEKHESMCAWCEYRELCMSCGSPGIKEAMYHVRTVEEVYQYQQED